MVTHDLSFLTLTLRNFMSFGNNITVIPLNRIGSTFIEGVNLDNTGDGLQSNGTGKSTILNGLVYALYDKPVSDIRLDNMVNNINGKHMEVTLEFIKNGVNYKIKRERKMKAGASGNNSYLYINGEDKTKAGKVNEQILEIIGISYDLFVRIVVFTASLESFLKLKSSEQTSFVEELFGITTLSSKAENLKKLIKDTEQDIQLQKSKISSLEKEHERHLQQIENVKNRVLNWETTQSKIKIDTEQKLTNTELEYAQKIESATVDLNWAIANLNNLDTSVSFDELRTNRATLDNLLVGKRECNSNIQQLINSSSKLESQIKSNTDIIKKSTNELTKLQSNTCPYCNQEYKETITKIDEIEKNIKVLTSTNLELEDELGLIETELNTLTNQLIDINNSVTIVEHVPSYEQIANMEREPEKRQQKVEQLTQKLFELEQPNNPYNSLIDTHKQSIIDLEDELNPYVEVYDELSLEVLEEIDYTKINELSDEIEHQRLLLKLLTKKDSFIRKAILNKSIPFLNSRLQHYLHHMGLQHKIEFNHELSVDITLMGRALSFGNFSAGQSARVNFALSLAFRDLLQSSTATINIWMLDEILDIGLDTVGVQAAVSLVRKKAKDEQSALYLISHRDECYGLFDNKIQIQMVKGFSYVV